jgi:hypothetical protein
MGSSLEFILRLSIHIEKCVDCGFPVIVYNGFNAIDPADAIWDRNTNTWRHTFCYRRDNDPNFEKYIVNVRTRIAMPPEQRDPWHLVFEEDYWWDEFAKMLNL